MINNVTLIGRLTKDIELKTTGSGKFVATGTLAVNRQFNKEETDFINITMWNKVAELTANYTKKGSQIGIVGRIQTRNYEGQDGKKVYITEVVAESVQFLDTKGSGEKQEAPKQPKSDDPFADAGKTIDIHSDDLPF